MSKQEIYAWCSLGFTLAIFVYYLIAAFGLPTGLEGYAENISSLIWKVIAITVIAEVILDILNSSKFGGVEKDERDIQIESKGFRNAYYFFIVSIIIFIGHILVNDFLSQSVGEQLFFAVPYLTFHILVFILFIANIIKSGTQLYFYQTVN